MQEWEEYYELARAPDYEPGSISYLATASATCTHLGKLLGSKNYVHVDIYSMIDAAKLFEFVCAVLSYSSSSPRPPSAGLGRAAAQHRCAWISIETRVHPSSAHFAQAKLVQCAYPAST